MGPTRHGPAHEGTCPSTGARRHTSQHGASCNTCTSSPAEQLPARRTQLGRTCPSAGRSRRPHAPGRDRCEAKGRALAAQAGGARDWADFAALRGQERGLPTAQVLPTCVSSEERWPPRPRPRLSSMKDFSFSPTCFFACRFYTQNVAGSIFSGCGFCFASRNILKTALIFFWWKEGSYVGFLRQVLVGQFSQVRDFFSPRL